MCLQLVCYFQILFSSCSLFELWSILSSLPIIIKVSLSSSGIMRKRSKRWCPQFGRHRTVAPPSCLTFRGPTPTGLQG